MNNEMEVTRLGADEGTDAEWHRSVDDALAAQADGRDADNGVPYYGTCHDASGSERDFSKEDECEAGGMDVMDAFEDFNLRVRLLYVHVDACMCCCCCAFAHRTHYAYFKQAQERMQELLDATDRKVAI